MTVIPSTLSEIRVPEDLMRSDSLLSLPYGNQPQEKLLLLPGKIFDLSTMSMIELNISAIMTGSPMSIKFPKSEGKNLRPQVKDGEEGDIIILRDRGGTNFKSAGLSLGQISEINNIKANHSTLGIDSLGIMELGSVRIQQGSSMAEFNKTRFSFDVGRTSIPLNPEKTLILLEKDGKAAVKTAWIPQGEQTIKAGSQTEEEDISEKLPTGVYIRRITDTYILIFNFTQGEIKLEEIKKEKPFKNIDEFPSDIKDILKKNGYNVVFNGPDLGWTVTLQGFEKDGCRFGERLFSDYQLVEQTIPKEAKTLSIVNSEFGFKPEVIPYADIGSDANAGIEKIVEQKIKDMQSKFDDAGQNIQLTLGNFRDNIEALAFLEPSSLTGGNKDGKFSIFTNSHDVRGKRIYLTGEIKNSILISLEAGDYVSTTPCLLIPMLTPVKEQ